MFRVVAICAAARGRAAGCRSVVLRVFAIRAPARARAAGRRSVVGCVVAIGATARARAARGRSVMGCVVAVGAAARWRAAGRWGIHLRCCCGLRRKARKREQGRDQDAHRYRCPMHDRAPASSRPSTDWPARGNFSDLPLRHRRPDCEPYTASPRPVQYFDSHAIIAADYWRQGRRMRHSGPPYQGRCHTLRSNVRCSALVGGEGSTSSWSTAWRAASRSRLPAGPRTVVSAPIGGGYAAVQVKVLDRVGLAGAFFPRTRNGTQEHTPRGVSVDGTRTNRLRHLTDAGRRLLS